MQPLAAAGVVGIGSQAPAEAAPPMTAVVTMATVVAVATVSGSMVGSMPASMTLSMPAPMPAPMPIPVPVSKPAPPPGEPAETAEAVPGTGDGQRAVVAVVTHRADRTETTIVVEVSVLTFMVVAPASKQMHVAIPR